MTKPHRQSFDLFLAHDPTDNALARAVMDRLQAEGVESYSPYLSEPEPLDPVAETVRRGIQESFSFGVLLTPVFLRSDVLPFHTGGAAALNTPAYLLLSGVTAEDIPPYLRKLRTGELWDGLPGIAADIRKRSAPLTAEQTQAMIAAYQEVGEPVDRLMMESDLRAKFADAFASKCPARLPAERLVRELTRLRKSRRLPRLASRAAG